MENCQGLISDALWAQRLLEHQIDYRMLTVDIGEVEASSVYICLLLRYFTGTYSGLASSYF